MRDVAVFICLVAYAAFSLHAGYFASYRDEEDICNQISHVFAMLSVMCFYFIPTPSPQFGVINKYFSLALVILTIAELIDEVGKANGAVKVHDIAFPIITVLLTALFAWSSLKKK